MCMPSFAVIEQARLHTYPPPANHDNAPRLFYPEFNLYQSGHPLSRKPRIYIFRRERLGGGSGDPDLLTVTSAVAKLVLSSWLVALIVTSLGNRPLSGGS